MNSESTPNQQLLRNLLFNIGGFVINLLLTFFMTPYLIRSIGKDAYGFYPLVQNMVGYTTIITTAVGSMGGRFITMAYYKGKYEDAQIYFNSIIFVNWLLSFLFGIFFIIVLIFLPRILQIPLVLVNDIRCLFGLSCLSLILGLCFEIFGIGTYVKNRIDLRSSRSLVTHFISAAVIVLLFWLLTPNIVYVAVGGLAGALVAVIFNVELKRHLLPELRINPLKYHQWSKVYELVCSGIWNSVNQLSNVLLNHIDLLIANIFISAAVMGDFAVVKIAPGLIYTSLAILSSTFTPSFNILYAEGENEKMLHEIKKNMKIVGMIICIPIGFLLVFADQFFHLWVPSIDSDYLYWLSFVTVLPMIIGSSINPIFNVFIVTNKLKVPSLVLLLAGILNTVVVFVLLKTTNLGIWAIPLVGAIQHGCRNFFFTPVYAAKCLGLNNSYFYPTVFKCCIALVVVSVVGLFVKNMLYGDTWLWLALEGSIVLLLGSAINMFIILNRDDRQYLVSKIKSFAYTVFPSNG